MFNTVFISMVLYFHSCKASEDTQPLYTNSESGTEPDQSLLPARQLAGSFESQDRFFDQIIEQNRGLIHQIKGKLEKGAHGNPHKRVAAIVGFKTDVGKYRICIENVVESHDQSEFKWNEFVPFVQNPRIFKIQFKMQ